VTGAACGIIRLSERLAAAREKVMLAPHWWHLVAVAPTSVPQAGHSRGRACAAEPERKLPWRLLRQRSSL
jgi:hypothetical protein